MLVIIIFNKFLIIDNASITKLIDLSDFETSVKLFFLRLKLVWLLMHYRLLKIY
jgi:hypothetical protein